MKRYESISKVINGKYISSFKENTMDNNREKLIKEGMFLKELV